MGFKGLGAPYKHHMFLFSKGFRFNVTDVDMLENVELGEQKQRDDAYKAAKKKSGIYADKYVDHEYSLLLYRLIHMLKATYIFCDIVSV